MESYNHPAWQYPRPPHHASSARPRHASISAPRPAGPPLPPSLTPGYNRARSSVQRPRTSHGSPSSLYGDYFFTQPQTPLSAPPPLPQKPQALLRPLTNSLPPIPPKPPALAVAPASRIPLYPTSIPHSLASPQPTSSETSPNEEEIELALSLSASDRKRDQELIAQEEEELARALEESRLLSNCAYALDEPSPSPSTDRASISAIKASAHPPEGESWLHMITPTPSISSQYSSLNEDPPPQNKSDDDTSLGDRHTSLDTHSATPPLYANVVSNLVRSPLSPPSPTAALSTTANSFTDYTLSSDHVPSSPSLHSEQSPIPPFSPRPSWSSVSSENGTSTMRSPSNELAPGFKSPTHPPASPDPSFGSSASLGTLDEEHAETESGSSTRQVIPPSANQYVEREMLLGITLGFNLPVISTTLHPMAGAMPNVITLPYGKAPVFHFQAPSWRRLLKLMARLSGTRVEPTIEALSLAKHTLRLRTVIQFVKIHHSASEWRTVLYLTTDYPTPSNLPNSHKYTNGDVSVLPYSYTLSPLPALLRDGSESPMAKYYVVPSTSVTPYPTLPINFPNLAMYLQSAVQDSRRAANDSSSGLRKLAQYIDSCYQGEAERVAPIDQEVAAKRGVGGMIKRVIGRNRANRNSRGNDEIYDLVTPFVSDEWG